MTKPTSDYKLMGVASYLILFGVQVEMLSEAIPLINIDSFLR